MPYSGPGDDSLPSNVKKLSESLRKQWVEVFNSCMSQGDSEATAFSKANGVVKKAKGYIDSYDVWDRQLSAEATNYDAYGAADGKGCANCNWFIGPEDCVLLSSTVAATGKCDLWREPLTWTPTPMPVTIVKDVETEAEGLFAKLKSLFFNHKARESEPTAALPPVQQTLRFFKQADGQLRFFTTYSNMFEDRQGEIIESEAHKEFVDYCEASKNYPELWLWHAGAKSKWGKCDWLDFSDGFVCASGLVTKGCEPIAERLEQEDIKVSHGFYGLTLPGTKSIIRYRTFEISPLPAWAAANQWTNFFINKDMELEMPFSDKRKEWLKTIGGLSDETVTTWEKGVEELSTKLKAIGVEWKDNESADLTGQVLAITQTLADIATKIAELTNGYTALQKSMDERVAEIFAAEIAKMPNGFRASESSTNVVPEEKKKEVNTEWFGKVLENLV